MQCSIGVSKIIVTLVALVVSATAHATECTDCEYKKRETRFEGVTAIGVSAPDLELLSFTSYCESVPAGTNANLKLSFFLPEKKDLYIVAKELTPKHYYMMRPAETSWAAGWQEFAPWPTAAVMNQLGIALNELGVLGRVGHDMPGSCEVVPICVFDSTVVDSALEYTLHFKPKVNLKSVRFVLVRERDGERIIDQQMESLFYGGLPFPITLDMAGQAEGYFKLMIVCRLKNRTGRISRTYSFYHRPQLGG